MTWLRQQLFEGWLKFEIIYILGLILLQIIAYIIAPDSIIGMISGLCGVLAVVMGMKGRKITFIFGTIQCLAMSYIAWESQAYGSFIMDIFYTISQPIGWFLWGNDEAVNTFDKKTRNKIFLGAFASWLVGGFILQSFEGQLPFFDSINLVISLIAQTLYIFKYKENWSLWIFVNIANLVYWTILAYLIFNGDSNIGTLGMALSQVALQGALLFNSIYANKVWGEHSKEQLEETEI